MENTIFVMLDQCDFSTAVELQGNPVLNAIGVKIKFIDEVVGVITNPVINLFICSIFTFIGDFTLLLNPEPDFAAK